MMKVFKKICKVLILPPPAVIIILLPVAIAMTVSAFVIFGGEHIFSYVSYAIAAYELTVICVRLPKFIKWVKRIKENNRYISLYTNDAALRTKISLYSTVLFNTVYAAFMAWQGIVNRSFWFFSLSAYYVMLDVVRLVLLRHMRSSSPRERILDELKRYRFCGRMLAFLNIALALMVFFVVYFNRGYKYNFIVTIAMAAYTFTTFSFAIVNVVKYRRFQSPVMSATRAISLAAAAVSMLTLETAMLTAFGNEGQEDFRRIMTAFTGAGVIAFILIMAIYMMIKANKEIRQMKEKACDEQRRKTTV